MSSSFQPHGRQHARLPCPSLSPSLLKLMFTESVMPPNHLILCYPLSTCSQSFPASESFPMSGLFASGGQSIEASASAPVLPMNIQDWFPLGLTGLISLGLRLSFFQNDHSDKTIYWKIVSSTIQLQRFIYPHQSSSRSPNTWIWLFYQNAKSFISILCFIIAFLNKFSYIY